MANLLYGTENFATTLNVGGGINNSQTTGIILTSVSGLNTNGGVLGFTWASTIDTATYEEIEYGGISGNELTGVVRGSAGTSAKTHANGAVIVNVVSSLHNNRIADKLRGVDTTGITVAAASFTTADPTIATGLNIQVNAADPTRGIYIPASAMFGATTNGPATGQIETTTNKINVKVLDFDASTEEYAFFNMPAPSYWDLGTVTAEFHWTAASGSGDVIWGIAGLARSNDDALDTALGTAVTVTDTLLTAVDEHLTSDTAAITIGGTPAKDDFLFFRVYRDADAGGDTLAVDARLIGVTIRFKRGQYEDS